MSQYFQTLAITLKKRPYKDNDCFFTFYTKAMGKVSVIVTGAKKVKSKLAGHLEPFGTCKISIAQGYFSHRLIAARTLKRFYNVSNNLGSIELAGLCLNLVDTLTKDHHPEEEVFELTKNAIEILDKGLPTNKVNIFYSVFILKLLTQLGFRPELYKCLKCKSKIKPNGNLFSPERGGLVCDQCKIIEVGYEADVNTIKLLRASLKLDFIDFLKIKANDNLVQEFKNITKSFLEFRI